MTRAIISKAEKRHIEIRNRLTANGVVGLGELCEILQCSESTIRNDLSFLEEKGELRRTIGGAIPIGMAHLGRDMATRCELYKVQKQSIARYIVSQVIGSGSTVMLDAGTTNIEIAQAILESSKPMSVITNNFPAAAAHWPQEENEVFTGLHTWLDGYFSGVYAEPLFRLNPAGTDFQREVWDLLMEIPFGTCSTYGAIAAKIAKKRSLGKFSSRAVGAAVGRNPISILIPCHRVIGSNGSLTGYAGGLDRKKRLHEIEGIKIAHKSNIIK